MAKQTYILRRLRLQALKASRIVRWFRLQTRNPNKNVFYEGSGSRPSKHLIFTRVPASGSPTTSFLISCPRGGWRQGRMRHQDASSSLSKMRHVLGPVGLCGDAQRHLGSACGLCTSRESARQSLPGRMGLGSPLPPHIRVLTLKRPCDRVGLAAGALATSDGVQSTFL